MGPRRIFWSVTPEQTNSPYIGDIAGALRMADWAVEPFTTRELLTTSDEIVHIQWPEHVSRGSSTATTLAKHLRTGPLLTALRTRGHRVVVTAHNRAPHGASDPVDAWFRSQVLAMADAIVVLVPEHGSELRESGAIGPRTNVVTIPHPIHAPKTAVNPATEQDLLVVLGQIHPYHLIEEFLDAFDHDVCPYEVLVIGGVGDDELLGRLRERASTAPWLSIEPGFADDAKLAPHLSRCAAVVSLQRNTFNSGGPFFALPRNLPIVMSAGAQANDLIERVGAEWVFPVEENVELRCVELNDWLGQVRSKPALSPFTLEAVTTAHIELYELLRS